MEKTEKSLRLLAAARKAWMAASDLRSRRRRAKRFTYGDQWGDMTTDRGGRAMTERQLAKENGRNPMTNNLIRRFVKCVIGHFRLSIADEKIDDKLAETYRANHLTEMDSRNLEEFLISGCAIQRISLERRNNGKGIWVDNVTPEKFFINRITDPRGWDTELIGMLHDWSLPEIIMRFANGDHDKSLQIRKLYNSINSGAEDDSILNPAGNQSFSRTADGRCRVIEVWTLEAHEQIRCHDPLTGGFHIAEPAFADTIERENEKRSSEGSPLITSRWELATRWRCRWIAPDGTVISEHDSPFRDGRHPFAVKFYPLIDGEVHSLVEDVLDQQVYVNNLITMINHIMSCSAKGALLFPIESLSDKMDLQQVARMWASPDAIIPYKSKAGAEPHQVSSNSSDIGARELLALEMQMFEDVSGVSNALMGKSTSGGNAGAERYESEVRNALVAINDLLATFNHFRLMRDESIENLL